jgi:hypothetical protein
MKIAPKVQVASMLRNTMLNLKQRNGASLAQIRKHMEANYSTKLDTTNKKRLATALKGLVQTGKVEKTPAGVYKLRKTAEQEGEKAAVPSRRRRVFPTGYCKTHTRYHSDVADRAIAAGATPGAAASSPRATASHTNTTTGVASKAGGNKGTQRDESQANLHYLQLSMSSHVPTVTNKM